MDDLAGALRAVPRLAGSSPSSARRPSRTPRRSCSPSAGPTSTGTSSSSTTRARSGYFDQHVPPALFDSFDEWRDATQAYQAALIQLQIEDLRRLKYAPTGGFCHFCFADGHPAVTWSVLDHERVPEARLRRAPRRVPDRAPDARAPRAGSSTSSASTATALAGRRGRRGDVDGRRHGWTGDVPADGIAFVGRVDLPPEAVDVDADAAPSGAGEVTNSYADVLEWLRIVSG